MAEPRPDHPTTRIDRRAQFANLTPGDLADSPSANLAAAVDALDADSTENRPQSHAERPVTPPEGKRVGEAAETRTGRCGDQMPGLFPNTTPIHCAKGDG